MLYSPHARCASISELRKMVNNTDCDALRLSRKLGTSSRRDDCARRTCDTETKMRSTERKFLPPETFFWYTAQPWANAQKVSAEKMRTTERVPIERAKCKSFGCFECSRCVREYAYSEELLFAFKRLKLFN